MCTISRRCKPQCGSRSPSMKAAVCGSSPAMAAISCSRSWMPPRPGGGRHEAPPYSTGRWLWEPCCGTCARAGERDRPRPWSRSRRLDGSGGDRARGDRLFPAHPAQRLRALGRRPQLHRQPELSGPVLAPAPLDVHDRPRGTLPAPQLGDARARLHPVGHEPDRLPPHQPAAARGERRPLLPRRCGAAAPRGRHRVRGRGGGGGAVLRHPSAARGVGGLGVGAARRPLRPLLPRHGAGLRAHGGGRADRRGAPLVPRVARVLRPLAPLEGLGHDAADRPRPARRVSAPAAAPAARESALRGARARRGGAGLPRAGAGAGDADTRGARAGRARGAGRVRALLLPLEDARPARIAWPATAAVLAVLGVLTFRQARVWRDSRALWDHTLALDPTNWTAYTNRGVARQARGDIDGALADYDMALRYNPGHAEALNDRGIVRFLRGDVDGAIADYTRALEVAPGDADRAMIRRNLDAAREERASGRRTP